MREADENQGAEAWKDMVHTRNDQSRKSKKVKDKPRNLEILAQEKNLKVFVYKPQTRSIGKENLLPDQNLSLLTHAQ